MKYLKMTIAILCTCISLICISKAKLYYGIVNFRWVGDYAISIYINNIDKQEIIYEYPFSTTVTYMDVNVSVYDGRVRWFLNSPCFTTNIAKHQKQYGRQNVDSWTILKANNNTLVLRNNDEITKISYNCEG